MSCLSGFFMLGSYILSFLLPSLAVGLGVWLTGFGDPAHARAGELSEKSWACDELVEKIQAGELAY